MYTNHYRKVLVINYLPLIAQYAYSNERQESNVGCYNRSKNARKNVILVMLNYYFFKTHSIVTLFIIMKNSMKNT